jgi:hypothetical protein
MELQDRKIRINFQELINRGGRHSDILLIYQWLIRTGKTCDKQHIDGLHKSFYGYSHNNDPYRLIPLYSDWEKILYAGLVNLLCKTSLPDTVTEFLTENRIAIGRVRIITVRESISGRGYFKRKTDSGNIKYMIDHLTTAYKGLELKKENFHPDYENRKHPRIINDVHFGTDGEGWSVGFTFSFECFDYDPGWEYSIRQEEFECLEDFFDRAIETIDNLLVDSNNCDNCPYWEKDSYRGDYLRHGYRGSCKRFGKCEKSGVVEYESAWGGKTDNAIYPSIVSPYYRTKK